MGVPQCSTYPPTLLVFTTNENSPVNVTIMNSSSHVLDWTVIEPGTYSYGYLTGNCAVENIYDRNKGLLISSDDCKTFSVVALPPFDSYTLYPVEMYEGLEVYNYYVILPQDSVYYDYNRMAIVVAAYNNTSITITPTQTLTIPADLINSESDTNITRGETISISLHYLQTFLLKSHSDLSGTKVTSNKPIGLFCTYYDGLGEEQMLPTYTWGMQFAFVPSPYPLAYMDSAIAIVSSVNYTSVNLTCSPGSVQTYDLVSEETQVLIPISSNASACTVTSSEPIFVVQTDLYFPLMIPIPPLHLLTNDNIMIKPRYGYIQTKVDIVLTGGTLDTSNLFRDGSVINDTLWNAAHLSNNDVIAYVTSITLDSSLHTLTITDNSMRMAATVYGADSFLQQSGHTIGMNLAIPGGMWY